MEPFREKVFPLEAHFPLRVFNRSSLNEYIHVHPHWHDHYEILLIERGTGTQQVGPHVFRFFEGDILPIPCGAVHSTYTDSSCDNDILVITFHRDLPAAGILHVPECQVLDAFFDEIQPPLALHPKDDPDGRFHALLRELAAEWQTETSGRELMIRARLLEWIVLMVRWCESHGQPVLHRADLRTKETLRQTFDRIDREFALEFHVADAANAACLSVSQFERLFKAHTGQTFLHYLNRYRIRKACECFASGNTLTEIAYSCGFGSLATFTRVFRQVKGVAPSVLRKGGP